MSPQLAPAPSIEKEYLILGEGKGDASFFYHLCRMYNVEGFQIEEAGGTGKFQSYLSGLSSRTGFDRLKAILVVADNDDTPADSFSSVRVCLKKAKLPHPDEPLRVKRNGAQGLAVAVMMIPYSVASGPTRGCLETLLLRAIEQNKPEIKTCVDAYFGCLAANWTRSQEDKFRVRCSIAAMLPDDPNFGLQWALEPTKNMIPLNHNAFGEIVQFLRDFPTLCSVGHG